MQGRKRGGKERGWATEHIQTARHTYIRKRNILNSIDTLIKMIHHHRRRRRRYRAVQCGTVRRHYIAWHSMNLGYPTQPYLAKSVHVHGPRSTMYVGSTNNEISFFLLLSFHSEFRFASNRGFSATSVCGLVHEGRHEGEEEASQHLYYGPHWVGAVVVGLWEHTAT